MAIPQWTYPSNTNLGTIQERRQTTVPVLVFDNEDRSTVETNNFTTEVDSTILPIYSNRQFFWVKSSGLAQTPWLGEPSGYTRYTPIAQSYVFKFPRDQYTIDGETTPAKRKQTNTLVSGFLGVAINGVPFKSPNSGITVKLGDRTYTENAFIFPFQDLVTDLPYVIGPNQYPSEDYFVDGSGIIGSDRAFYYHSDPRLLYTKDSTKHSPIIGYAFDGNPIYGPYGYINPLPHTITGPNGDLIIDGNPPLKIMKSSYKLTEVQRDSGTIPDGTYIEDFIYEQGLGDLDEHNGRFCKTPEYPGGTYAYFITVDPDNVNLPRYPYIIGPTYYQEPLLPNGNLVFPGDISLSVISGQIPAGMRIEGLSITGVPFEVSRLTTFRFVLRATNLDGFSDRTYSITVDGADLPLWETPAGDLEIGAHGTRQTVLNRLIARNAEAGDTVIKVNSVFNLINESIITCKSYPNSIIKGTMITRIDKLNKLVTLSKPLAGPILIGYDPNTPSSKTNKITTSDAVIGHTSLHLDSVSRLHVGDLVKAKYEVQLENAVITRDYVVPNTIITDINYLYNIITISTPLLHSAPTGTVFTFIELHNTELTFTYTAQHTNLFVLDNQYVSYQLSAIDSDLAAGGVLKYYIPPRGGTLPLGLTLSEDGLISGFTEAILANEQADYNGNYDMQLYDKFAYDYGVRPYNGYDSFLFDTTTFDFSDETRSPRKVNRYYQFIVRVSDGIHYTDRKFRIFVIGDDFFRADTTVMEAGNNTYTADVSAIRTPFWITPSYLGRRRANNYITTYLDVYLSPTLSGTLAYVLDPVNDDGSPSILPRGMSLDQITGEIYGDVPYQPAVTKTYKFTVRAIRYDPDSPMYGYAKTTSGTSSIGQHVLKLDSVLSLQLNSLVTGPRGVNYITPGSIITAIDKSTNSVTLNTPLLETVPPGEIFTFSYVVSSAKTFTIDIMGEVDSTIRFITPGNLGTIPANFISELSVSAITTVSKAVLNYTLIGGKLPPGLTLIGDGTIQGKVNQYATDTAPGLTSFDNNDTSFDKFNTSIDRNYTFIVLAQDQFQYSAVTKIFTVSVTTPDNLLYSNIYVKPFLNNTKRLELTDFFSNPEIFPLQMIYRASDPSFGVQNELKMLLYSGIETKVAAEYVTAVGRSSKKRYRFGRVKKAIAKTPGTNNVVYEAVYIEIIDNLENNKGSVSKQISTNQRKTPLEIDQTKRDLWDSSINDNNIDRSNSDEYRRPWIQDRILTADYSGQKASDSNKTDVFGNSTTNIRNNIADIGSTERNFLPLWMRTPQTFSGVAQDFTKGILLCYAKPGYGDTIINNIKNLGIDFKSVDFTVDRVIIDSVKGEVGDKYIAFGAREIIYG